MLSVNSISFTPRANSKGVTNYQQNQTIKLHSQPIHDEVSFKSLNPKMISSFPEGYKKTLELAQYIIGSILSPKQEHLKTVRAKVLDEISSHRGLSSESIPEFKAVLSETLADGKEIIFKEHDDVGTIGWELRVIDNKNPKYRERYVLNGNGLELDIAKKNSDLPNYAFSTAKGTERAFENANKKVAGYLQVFLQAEKARKDELRSILKDAIRLGKLISGSQLG